MTADDPSAPPPPAPRAEPGAAARGLTFLGVLVCFVASGFAALLYQTAWMRQFSVVFGTSELAVATVLAAYMAGLALGAAVAGKLVHRVRRPVLVYGFLELGVALGALAVPLELQLARSLQAQLIGGGATLPDAGGSAQALFYLAASFVVILVPTTCMGATLPLLTRHVVRKRAQIGTRVGLLYAMNTAGAVAGALVAAFTLLPLLGLRNTVLVGVALNGLVFLVAAALSRLDPGPARGDAPADGAPGAAEPDEPPGDARARWILPLVLASGVTSFTYEVVWTRLLSHVVGGSVQAFATMLASFLTGITLGSLVASFFARGRRISAVGFALCQLGVAGASAWVYSRIDGLVEYAPLAWEARVIDAIRGPLATLLGSAPDDRALHAFLVLLPATLAIGATFPFALRTLARSSRTASSGSARVYAWNTVGAIAGAVLAGFLIVPALGFAGTARAMVLANAGLAVATAMLVFGRRGWPLATLASAGVVALLVTFQPTSPDRLLRYSLLDSSTPEGDLLYQRVGRSATVTMLAQKDAYEVRSNGLPEAAMRPAGASPFGRDLEHLLTALPVVARPAARSMMVIGFGGGVALERVPSSIETIDVVELEPEILAANRAISGRRAIDPFDDPRLRIVTNDARGALALTDARWDIVVSQPSHPWTAGASHLYTREFLAQVREHLTDDGVLVQWMQAAFLDEELLRALGATLLDAFPHVRLYRPAGGMLVFLASSAPLDVEREVARTGRPFDVNTDEWRDIGLSCLEDVLSLLALDQAGLEKLCADAPVSTDDRNLLAMRAKPQSPGNLTLARIQQLFLDVEDPDAPALDPVLDRESSLMRDLGGAVDRAYLARRMIYSLRERAILSTNVLTDPAEKKYAQGWARASWAFGDFAGAAQDLQNALAARPGDERVGYANLRPLLAGIARNEPALSGAGQMTVTWRGGGRDVLEGLRAAARADWAALAALEERLAAAEARDPWYVDALRLRALARLRGSDPAPDEALALCDRALVFEPDPGVLLVRLEAAEAAARPRAVVETLHGLCDFAGERAKGLPGGLGDEVVAGLRGWKARLPDLAQPWPEAERRRDEVAALLVELVPDVEIPKALETEAVQEFR